PMFDSAAPNQPDLDCQLLGNAYYHLIRTLRLTLPPPPGDSAEDLLRRDHAAIARIAALAPANAAEADVAAQFVAASEQWKDCLRLAQAPETTPEWVAKCRAQAASMIRQVIARSGCCWGRRRRAESWRRTMSRTIGWPGP